MYSQHETLARLRASRENMEQGGVHIPADSIFYLAYLFQ
jgi:hypothetical protein